MWRWHELLPVQDPQFILDLGEGDTPLLRLPQLQPGYHGVQFYLKEEGLNPTGSFKARGLSAAVSRAAELGVQQLIIPTAGNAGGALAAYAARGGLAARIYMPVDTPAANQIESRLFGADVQLVEGLISDAGRKVQQDSSQGTWFDMSTFKEPYRVEGKKIMGYELAQQFNWRLPEVLIYPTGGGTGLIGMWKAFKEMAQMGWLEQDQLPRMVVVQAQGCAPVVQAYKQQAQSCTFWEQAQTIASGLRVPKSFADRLIMQTIYVSQGCAVAVSDQQIQQAWVELAAKEGIFAAPEGAATWAAAKELARSGWIASGERVVLFNTGSGYKYLDLLGSFTLH
jgi:threonine synthase